MSSSSNDAWQRLRSCGSRGGALKCMDLGTVSVIMD